MKMEGENGRMTIEEVQELLDLKGWSRTKLGGELGITQNAIDQWFSKRRCPSGPASILMRMWLAAARAESKGKKPVPA